MIPGNYNLPDAYRGDSYGPLTFKFKDGDGNYLDFTAARIDLQVKNKKNGVVVLFWSTEDDSIQVSNFDIILNLVTGDRMKMPQGAYDYDLQIIKDESTKTYIKGELSVIQDVTQI
jgi:hypothetical protein